MQYLTQHEATIVIRVLRQLVYIGLLTGAMVIMWKIANMYPMNLFAENGLIENIQMGVLMLTAAIFGVEAWCIKPYRSVLTCLMSLCLLGLIREQDAFFEQALPVISWKFAFLFPILATLNALRNVKNFKQRLIAFFEMPSFYLMLCAVIVIIPVAECIGHRSMIEAVLGTEMPIKSIRRLFEESGELLGYLLILFSTIEFLFNIREHKTEK